MSAYRPKALIVTMRPLSPRFNHERKLGCAKAPRDRRALSCRISSSFGISAKDMFEDIKFFVGQLREVGTHADRPVALASVLDLAAVAKIRTSPFPTPQDAGKKNPRTEAGPFIYRRLSASIQSLTRTRTDPHPLVPRRNGRVAFATPP